MGEVDPAVALAVAGLVIGGLFGAVVQRTHFCTMGAVSDFVLFGSARRLRVWALAIATALLGTQALAASGLVPLAQSGYLAPRLFWLGAVLGGILFGHGMVLAGGCASRGLVRVGGGSLKALFALFVMAATAFLVTSGPLALVTRWLGDVGSLGLALPTQGLDAVLARAGLPAARPLATALLLLPLLLFALKDARFRTSLADAGAGLAIGLLVTAGWAATAWLADPFAPTAPVSLAFVAPTGRLLLWLMTGNGQLPSFAVAAVAGTLIGAALVALLAGRFRLETFVSRDDMVRHGLGGALMGVGGALAMGCSVGQGITGVSTLSLQSLLALASILAGAAWGVRSLETGRLLPWPQRVPAAAASPVA